MSRLKAANNAQTALAALMDASATTCTVVSGDLLPAVPFRASIDNEIIEVGAKSGNTLSSILRGQEGTTAAAHQSGSLVEGKMTAGMHNELLAPTESLTVSQTTAPTGNTGTISQILGYLANRIKAITGKTNWYDAPSKTLEDVNAHVAKNAIDAHAAMPSCRVYGVQQSIATATWTVLAFASEHYDTDTMHDTSTNNSRLTVTTAGKYHISGHVGFEANATGIRAIAIKTNGTSDFLAVQNANAVSGAPHYLSISADYNLSAGDYVELVVYQTSGGALNIVRLANYTPEFGMTKVG